MQKIIIFLLFHIFRECPTKYIEGVLRTREKWSFLTRFCFLSQEGQFEYYLEFNENQGVPNLLFYYDTSDQWPSVYKSDKTCYEKEAVLHTEQKQIINLTANNAFFRELSRCSYYSRPPHPTPPPPTKKTSEITVLPTENSKNQYETFDSLTSTLAYEHVTQKRVPIKKRSLLPTKSAKKQGNRTVVCHNVLRFKSSRERWWFIAISNCKATKGIEVKYNILMTNGPPGDFWHEHFSADEFYILPILIGASVAYSFLLLAVIICSMELKSRQLLHTTYKIFVLSTIFQFFGVIVVCAAYLKYAMHGIGPSSVRRFGAILIGISESLYLLLLLLLAKGYTITRGRLPLKASVKLTVFMCLYIVTYISIFIYEANVFDPGEVLYLYESPAGYGLITLRIFAWFMFIYSTIFTLKHYPEKANFYYPFNVCGTLWFVAGPAFILSANTYIDKWVRESVVCAVLQFITFGGHLAFLVLTMPSVANKNFPYHVRTSQIGVMGDNGGDRIEQFSQRAYQPSNNMEVEQIVVPLTRRTEEIFEGMYSHDIMQTTRTKNLTNNESGLDWALAKNAGVVSLPNSSQEVNTIHSPGSENSSETLTNRRQSLNPANFDDYVRDVPVELFTVSKMTSVPKTNQ